MGLKQDLLGVSHRIERTLRNLDTKKTKLTPEVTNNPDFTCQWQLLKSSKASSKHCNMSRKQGNKQCQNLSVLGLTALPEITFFAHPRPPPMTLRGPHQIVSSFSIHSVRFWGGFWWFQVLPVIVETFSVCYFWFLYRFLAVPCGAPRNRPWWLHWFGFFPALTQ